MYPFNNNPIYRSPDVSIYQSVRKLKIQEKAKKVTSAENGKIGKIGKMVEPVEGISAL